MPNKIYVIGAGAVGKVLAVSLSLAGKDVTILRGSVRDQPSRKEKIQITLNGKESLEADIEIGTLDNFTELDGIIVLTNKSYGNVDLAEKLKNKAGNSPVVILQNGLGIEQPFINYGFGEIYRCVLFMTSQYAEDNTISYKPVAVSPIGAINSQATNLDTIVGVINSPNFQFKAERNIQKIIWEKAIINSVFNSICPLLEIDNGIFYREAKVMELAKRVISECIQIAGENNLDLKQEEIEERVLFISKTSDGQFISTLQDIRNKRETEIDTLNLEMWRLAKKASKENLVKETKLLGELTQLKSTLSR